MKLYAYSVRRKPGTEELVPYRRGPFLSPEEWHQFLSTKHARAMGMDYVAVDEDLDPPVLRYSGALHKLDRLALPYPLLIRRYDGALITGNGTLVFEGGPR